MKENLYEQLLEQLYWEFDTNRKTKAERDAFKGKMRFFANHTLKQKDNNIEVSANITSTGKNCCQCSSCLGSIYKPYSYSWKSYKYCPHCGIKITIKHNGKEVQK